MTLRGVPFTSWMRLHPLQPDPTLVLHQLGSAQELLEQHCALLVLPPAAWHQGPAMPEK